jgi:hypothetical protein
VPEATQVIVLKVPPSQDSPPLAEVIINGAVIENVLLLISEIEGVFASTILSKQAVELIFGTVQG